MERISSATNADIKMLRALNRKKARNETGLFLAEGERLVREALAHKWQAEILAFSETAMQIQSHQARLSNLIGRAKRDILLPERLVEKISTKPNAARIVGAFRKKSPEIPHSQKSGRWLALYEVRDPGNLGTVLRTADCLDASGVILIGQCCDPYSIEAVRASMGALFALCPHSFSDFATFNQWRKQIGLKLYAAVMDGQTTPDALPLKSPHCWLMGNEQAGLPKGIAADCDNLICIPMRDGADSLNLAQATTILTYETWRQCEFK